MGVGALKPGRGRAVFLDRDGVINQAVVKAGKPYPPTSLDELVITPGAAEDLARLVALDFRLLVVTNQPDVARGSQSRAVVEAINARLREALPLDQIYTCFHDDRDECECRKPRPGLIYQAAQEWQIDPAQSFLVGDRWKDIAAGQAAGCTTLLIEMGYAESQPATQAVTPDYRVNSLGEAVAIIVELEVNLKSEI